MPTLVQLGEADHVAMDPSAPWSPEVLSSALEAVEHPYEDLRDVTASALPERDLLLVGFERWIRDLPHSSGRWEREGRFLPLDEIPERFGELSYREQAGVVLSEIAEPVGTSWSPIVLFGTTWWWTPLSG